MALRRTDVPARRGVLAPAVVPAGYGPGDLQSAYALPSGTAGAGQTVAIVDAYDDPNAEADLAVYRAQYGLPSCTTANGCFRKVDQQGGTSYPTPDEGWSTEMSLDVDMVSATCPKCHILLVEATDPTLANLGSAVDEAVALGAKYVSNSYATTGEDPSDPDGNVYYRHPGVVMTASSGDAGYAVNFPASSPYVTAVGGTSLVKDSNARGWLENAWSGAGSGCSKYETKPAWQGDAGCSKRTVADVSAVADPGTGVAVYDTYQYGGWDVFGGTSVSSPIIASVYALAGTPQAGTYPAEYPYDDNLVGGTGTDDVVGGSNGTCSPAYLCAGVAGYDGPTGLGSPNGVRGFTYRAHGKITGTVTDAATGKPVVGATVDVGRMTKTDGKGDFTLDLPVGTYKITITEYGYQPRTVAGVAVTAGTTKTENLTLIPKPRANVAGTITDGSGHGWPLYAKITSSDGTVAFSDPATGRYSLSLIQNADYTLHIAAIAPGYTAVNKKVSVKAAGIALNTALTVTSACTAAGYKVTEKGTTQAFGASRAPAGWKVANTDLHQPGYGYQPGWVFTDPGRRANHTGGSGNFAIVDSDHDGQHNIQDTHLISPVINMSGNASPAVVFANDLEPAVNSTATVDVSVNGGSTWTNAWRESGLPGVRGSGSVTVLLPTAAHKAKVEVRFGYTGQWSQWWAIDNVFLGNRTCTAVKGGLVVGRAATTAGTGIKGATVTGPSGHTTTVAAVGDPNLNGGFYSLFSAATGVQHFTASMSGYKSQTVTGTVTAGHVVRLNFSLASAS
jgi:Carboxypeptidase regulatory-like domain